MLNKITIWGFLAALFASSLVLETPVCTAQITGYINGTQSLTSFDAETGAVVNSFSTGGTGQAFAVALNDTTLYLPAGAGAVPGRAFDVVNGLNGQLVSSLPLEYAMEKVVLTSQGGTAFAMGFSEGGAPDKVFAIDLATLKVTATLTMPPIPYIEDIALSPDDTTLFVSLNCFGTCTNTQGDCPLTSGICSFSTSTLALKATAKPGILEVNGYLSVSQDSKTLYVSGPGFNLVDSSTLLPIYKDAINFPYRPVGPAIVSPVGHYAIVLVGLNAAGSDTAYVLDTSINRFVAEFFVNAPFDAIVAQLPAAAAFAPDGHSFWMLLKCDGLNCPLPGETGRALAQIAFPSGNLIGAVPVPGDVGNLAFPRVTAK